MIDQINVDLTPIILTPFIDVRSRWLNDIDTADGSLLGSMRQGRMIVPAQITLEPNNRITHPSSAFAALLGECVEVNAFVFGNHFQS